MDLRQLISDTYRYEVLPDNYRKYVFIYLEMYHSVLGVKYPRVPTAQVIQETGYLKSNIAKTNNNWHGFKCDKRCGCEGVKNGHAFFSGPPGYKSILAYKCWQKKILKANPWVKNEDDYLKMLNGYKLYKGDPNLHKYAEDPNYIKNLRKIITKW